MSGRNKRGAGSPAPARAKTGKSTMMALFDDAMGEDGRETPKATRGRPAATPVQTKTPVTPKAVQTTPILRKSAKDASTPATNKKVQFHARSPASKTPRTRSPLPKVPPADYEDEHPDEEILDDDMDAEDVAPAPIEIKPKPRTRSPAATKKSSKSTPSPKAAATKTKSTPSPKGGVKKATPTPKKNLVCSKCNKIFKNRLLYQVHVKTHDTTSRAKRSTVEVPVTDVPPASPVRRTLKNDKERQPRSKSAAEVAVEEDHDVEQPKTPSRKPHPCPHCDMILRTKHDMENHIRSIHGGEKPHSCPSCGAAFVQANQLIYHVKTKHNLTEERFYNCLHEGCNHKFKHKSDLDKHYRIHTNEKPYACRLCDKAFTQANGLKNHMFTRHDNADPYGCSVENCDATFLQKKDLRLHMYNQHTADAL